MDCPKCGSNNTIENDEDGDTFFHCRYCRYTVENGVETRKSRKEE